MVMGFCMLSGIRGRLYTDYLMPGRWGEYRNLLATAQTRGYEFVCHREGMEAIARNQGLLFLLRHDVDSQPSYARKMFRIEQELGIRSTYYFRLCTLDIPLMKEISQSGSEVGYHFEEGSDFIKEYGIQSREALLHCMDEVRQRFLKNLRKIEEAFGSKIQTVAAHGDWANRRLRFANQEIVNDEVRASAGITLEGYDDRLCSRMSFRAIDDSAPPTYWRPSSPLAAVEAKLPNLLVVVHPGQWQRAPICNFKNDSQRVMEALHYRWKRHHGSLNKFQQGWAKNS